MSERAIVSMNAAKDGAFMLHVERVVADRLRYRYDVHEVTVRRAEGWFTDEGGNRYNVVGVIAEGEVAE